MRHKKSRFELQAGLGSLDGLKCWLSTCLLIGSTWGTENNNNKPPCLNPSPGDSDLIGLGGVRGKVHFRSFSR